MKKESSKILHLNKKIVSNLRINTVSGGFSTLHCAMQTIYGFTCESCGSCDCDPHTTDPGEIGPCTETQR